MIELAALTISAEIGIAVVTATTGLVVTLWKWVTKKDAQHIASLESMILEERQMLRNHIESEQRMTNAVVHLTGVLKEVREAQKSLRESLAKLST